MLISEDADTTRGAATVIRGSSPDGEVSRGQVRSRSTVTETSPGATDMTAAP
jgi:hypothetical protein